MTATWEGVPGAASWYNDILISIVMSDDMVEEVLIDMLIGSDPNMSYFAATRVPVVLDILATSNKHALTSRLLNQLKTLIAEGKV